MTNPEQLLCNSPNRKLRRFKNMGVPALTLLFLWVSVSAVLLEEFTALHLFLLLLQYFLYYLCSVVLKSIIHGNAPVNAHTATVCRHFHITAPATAAVAEAATVTVVTAFVIDLISVSTKTMFV